MVVSEDLEKKNAVFSSANSISGFFQKRVNTWFAYFSLDNENEVLRNENLQLRKLLALQSEQKTNEFQGRDTLVLDSVKYRYFSAKVINNSIYRKQNYITIDKGFLDGIRRGFGVVGPDGVVGVVVAVTDHYTLIVSLLNNRIGISAKIKKSHHFGSVHWNENDYRKASLMEIPNHISIAVGDTIVTNGFSAIFPANINIGTIAEFNMNKSNNFYEIDINLTTDFKNLYNVYVIDNTTREELILLKNLVQDEY